jgi:hypothetical protein
MMQNLSTSESTPTPGNETEVAPLEPSKKELVSLTQSVLQTACKRAVVSWSGSKAVLVSLLAKQKFADVESVQRLASEYDANPERMQIQGELGNSGIGSRDREPNWSKNEYARLCHVVCDPRNATALTALYNRPESRAELDNGRHDPWSNEIPAMFNDPQFCPDVPEISGGAIQEEIDQFYPAFWKHKRTGSLLKKKWTGLRSKFSVAYTKWSSSGQGDFDTFPNFTEDDTSLVYCFCVFHGKPALENAVRLLPTGAEAEQGLPGMDTRFERGSLAASRKHASNKVASSVSFADAALQLADAISRPLRIERAEDSRQVSVLMENADVAETVVKLMALEEKLLDSIATCKEECERKATLQARLANVSERIETSMGIKK